MTSRVVGHVPRKRFGQNFLHDTNVIRRIAACIAPTAGQRVLEIGPGQGALTQPLLDSGAQVTAIEIDRDLAAALRSRYANTPLFILHAMDALKLDLTAISEGSHLPWRVVGNLPYNISTPLLFHLLGQRQCIADMHFMLQKEVVDRLIAEPNTADYGRLSVMAQYYCDVVHAFDVSPGAFFPVPKVMSAIVRLVPRQPMTEAACESVLSTVVSAAFSQRRKTLRNTLAALLDETEIRLADVDPSARAETLCVNQFVSLANRLVLQRQQRRREV